jgi:hypothetical protein
MATRALSRRCAGVPGDTLFYSVVLSLQITPYTVSDGGDLQHRIADAVR